MNENTKKALARMLGAGLGGAFGAVIKAALENDNTRTTQSHGHDQTKTTSEERNAIQDIREQEEAMWMGKQTDDMWDDYRQEAALRVREEEDIAWQEKQDKEDETREFATSMEPELPDFVAMSNEDKRESEFIRDRADSMATQDFEDIDFDYSSEDADEDENQETTVIDNTGLSFNNRPICIHLNERIDDRRNKLNASEAVLCKRFQGIKELPHENRLQQIIDAVFPDGFPKHMYIRNLSFEGNSGYEITVLGIRPEIYDDDFLNQVLPDGCSLLFKGHLNGKVFMVDGIYEVADTERLNYEVEVTAIPYNDVARVGANFLYDIKNKADSLTRYTGENLNAWREYLDWKKELAKRQIFGCKYYKLTFDENTNRLVFWLVCRNKEYFQAFRKYLYRDVHAFNNDYSSNNWVFQLADMDRRRDNRKRLDRSIELGRCRGVVKEYYLDPDSDSESAEDEYALVTDDFEDDDYAEVDETEADIRNAFETPYIVQVAFELNRSDMDSINERNLEDSEISEYIRENVIGNYYANGFLALSAVGDFVLIDRFQQAIGQLERDECYSPNLAAWLFNVQQARLPDSDDSVQIDRWLNPNIAENDNQKEAVRKMLMAPDLCLIQGPPGTGKTTVIAEAIYQLVHRGNRVLVASQSNDAVDNALERLADTPVIRAIRLGQKGRRKRKDDKSDPQKFSEDTALLYYYHALSQQISGTWLDRWSALETKDAEYSRAIRDARLFNEDIADLNKFLAKCNESVNGERRTLSEKKAELEAANEHNTTVQSEERQFQVFEAVIKQENDTQFFLTDAQIRYIEPVLNSVIGFALRKGIYLAPAELNLAVLASNNAENGYIAVAIRRMAALSQLKARVIEASTHSSSGNAEVRLLQIKKDEIRSKMDVAMLDDDDDLFSTLRIEFKRISLEIDKMKNQSSVIEIGNYGRYLTTEFQNLLNSENRLDAIATISDIEERWNTAVSNCLNRLSSHSGDQHLIETRAIVESIRASEGRLKAFNSERDKLLTEITQKQATLTTLSERYGIDQLDAETIIESIRSLQRGNADELAQQQQMRSEWEATLRGFKKRLDDNDSFSYDQEYYQQIYINACNVVGISCTDNMRNLTDNGYDDFDVVIIDEVSKATPPELLIPLMKARKAILVGDHRQLPPMFKEHEGSYEELVKNQDEVPEEIRSLMTVENFRRFKKMVTASLFKDYFENADNSIKHSLLVQYRMHSNIMDIINRFYDRRLSKGLTTEQENKLRSHGLTIKGIDGSSLIIPQNHAYWIDSSTLPSGKPSYENFVGKSTSACNFLEVYIIVELLKKMADAYRDDFASSRQARSVGVISFYQSQVRELRDAIKLERKHFDFSPISIDVNTVDRFQGKEKNIVITSLVRNNRNVKASEHVIAFERINVAFSRAQNLLVIVGAKHMYETLRVQLPNMDTPGYKTVPVYKNIMEDLNRKACFRKSDKLIFPELEEQIISRIQESGETKK